MVLAAMPDTTSRFCRASIPLAGGLLLALASLVAAACDERDDEKPKRDRPSPSPWARAAAEQKPPVQGRGDNVVLIITDTLRADKLGCYGCELDTSPEIDRLAAGGVRFERVIAQCSWTRPSIGSLVTGLHPRTLGLYRGKKEVLDDRFDLLSEQLEQSGYTTIGITANPQIAGRLGFDQGFDVYIDTPRDLREILGRKRLAELRRRSGERPKSRIEGLALFEMRKKPYGKFRSLFVFETALELIDKLPRGPHYIQINVMEVHPGGPDVRPEFAGRFSDRRHGRERRYLRAVRQISHDVDDFLGRLLERPGWERTLVVLASDHGEGLTDHPGIENGQKHGFLLYESQVVVPLILLHSGGSLRPGTVDRPVRNVDIMPTVLDLLDLTAPDEIAGRSLVPLLEDQGAEVDLPDRFVTETYRPDAAKVAVYDTRWKYFENRDDWPLLGERELQAVGKPEVGLFTDHIDLEPEISWELDDYLERWERDHPKSDPVYRDRKLPPSLTAQLKNLGYMGGDGDAGEDEENLGPP
jgi:arylsulfatase A-like enzyme